ncbi:twin-arginine translocase TatA/TatE family subunit [Rubripirellula sp.]|jgi:sec-independent protein translocase protein TatA|nr:twin-arginine translocase TatA/TatE family subunit [Rubripirellula sp.]MDB4750039.1 twin-arginine translocase TatA/TatE family subunit [Rubripirellula sp.]
MFGLGPFEMVVIGVIAVLLFGSNLPEVARKFGGSYREFRRGLNDVQQQFKTAEREAKNTFLGDETATSGLDSEVEDEPATPVAPKFKPPT